MEAWGGSNSARGAHMRMLGLICSIGAAFLAVVTEPHASAVFFAGPIAAQAESATAGLQLNRFGRRLAQYDLPMASYLLPTQMPDLCTSGSCCQEDDHASPVQLLLLDRTNASFGGRSYTTFYFSLLNSTQCQTSVDYAGCCSAAAQTLWIDVDPSLKVKYASINGISATSVHQDSFGYRMSLDALSTSNSSEGALLSLTVEGLISQLCPAPDLLGLPGLCSIIVEASTPSNPEACCPRGLSLPSTDNNWVPPTPGFQCMASMTTSAFAVDLLSVSMPWADSPSTSAVNYTLLLNRSSTCLTGPNSCCDMSLSFLTMKMLSSAAVLSVSIQDISARWSSAPMNEPGQDGYMALLVDGLALRAVDTPDAGIPMVVTVRVPRNATEIPQLCSNSTTNGSYGSCSYFLHSNDGFCCPAGNTNAIANGPVLPTPPILPPSPPPFPTVPPGTCDALYPVNIGDTSMTFSYYEYTTTDSQTEFVFLVTNHNGAGCAVSKAHCTDVCAWSLAVNDAIAGQLDFIADDSVNSGHEVVQRGPQAAVQFLYGPTGMQSITYTITAPVNTPLESLCRPHAFPGQGQYPCAAQIKSTSGVYAMVYFSQSDAFIQNYPPPSPVQPAVCDLSRPLTDSCVQVTSIRYNALPAGTILDFLVGRADPVATACAAEPANARVSFRVMLQPAVVDTLAMRMSYAPVSSASVNRSSGLTWSSTPTVAGQATHYSFMTASSAPISSICLQGLPGQPLNTCPVQFEGPINCFIGFVRPASDDSLTWSDSLGAVSSSSSSSTSKAAVVAPAVVVPVVVIALLALVAVLFFRRQKSLTVSSRSPSELHAPLATAASASSQGRETVQQSLDVDEVQVRFPATSSSLVAH
ncbi:hypothetical protein QJQ45_027372 [Haematococcus lacustris]|nr:hypothetical protein QJQ45_027372 [Haematococcus lacustris]